MVMTFEDGRQTIYLHLEVQSFAEEDFASRLHACFQGLSRADVLDALRLVAWMMQLPRAQTLQFREKIVDFDQMNATAYITDLEELAMEKGQTLAQQQAVIEALEIRFDRVPGGLREEIGRVADSARLHALLRAAIRCADLESFSKEL